MNCVWNLRPNGLVWLMLPTLAGAILWANGCGLGRAPARASYKLNAYWTGTGILGGAFVRPFGIAVGPDGSVYVTDAKDRVVKLRPDGEYLAEWGYAGNGPGAFSNPVGIAVGRDGSVYVSDYDQDRVQKFTGNGKFLLQFGSHGDKPGQFRAPTGLAVGHSGNLYVADFYNNRVQEFTPAGKLIQAIGHPGRMGMGALHYPTGVAAFSGSELLVADAYNYELQWFKQDGGAVRSAGYHLLWLWPRPAEGAEGFNAPTGVAVGLHGLIHVADSANHRVVMLSANGKFVTDWELPNPSPKVFSPEQVAISPGGSTVYATDFGGNRVIVVGINFAP